MSGPRRSSYHHFHMAIDLQSSYAWRGHCTVWPACQKLMQHLVTCAIRCQSVLRQEERLANHVLLTSIFCVWQLMFHSVYQFNSVICGKRDVITLITVAQSDLSLALLKSSFRSGYCRAMAGKVVRFLGLPPMFLAVPVFSFIFCYATFNIFNLLVRCIHMHGRIL